MRDDLVQQDASHQRVIADEPKCSKPRYLKNTEVSKVPDFDFTCNHDYFYYRDTDSDADYDYDDYDRPATHDDSVAKK